MFITIGDMRVNTSLIQTYGINGDGFLYITFNDGRIYHPAVDNKEDIIISLDLIFNPKALRYVTKTITK